MSIDERTIRKDSPKRFIKTLQRQLIRENPSALPNYGVDGELGSETTEWITRFQERKGLTVDGVAGPNTLKRLRDDIIYNLGDTGRGVELLQEDLMYFTVDLAYGASGEYGAGTEQGVKDFQYFNFMEVDGVAGPSTFYKIDELRETILIQEGDKGAHVRRIQKQLNEQDSVEISITVDGGYGNEVVDAVEKFQEALEQRVDGIVGPVTMNLLDLEAFHPSSAKEYRDYLESTNSNIRVSLTTESNTNKYTNLLEKNTVFVDKVPSSSKDLENTKVVRVTRDDEQLFMVYGGIVNDDNVSVYAVFRNEELEHMVFVDVDGDQYEDNTKVSSYDTNGNSIEEYEDTVLELTNANLDIKLELTKFIQNNTVNKVYSMDAGEELCEIQGALVVGLTCATIISTGAGILCGVLLKDFAGEVWCPKPSV